MSDFHDERIAARVRLWWHLAGAQDSTRPNHELRDRLVAEFNRDFVAVSPQDRERAMAAIRRMTAT